MVVAVVVALAVALVPVATHPAECPDGSSCADFPCAVQPRSTPFPRHERTHTGDE